MGFEEHTGYDEIEFFLARQRPRNLLLINPLRENEARPMVTISVLNFGSIPLRSFACWSTSVVSSKLRREEGRPGRRLQS